MMSSVKVAEMSCDAIVQRVGDVILRISPLSRICLSVMQPLPENGSNSVLPSPQTESCWMRHPFGKDEIQHVPNVGFHAMKQVVQFRTVLSIEVGPHQALDDDGVYKFGNMLEEVNVFFSRPIGQESLRCFSGYICVVIQRYFAIYAPAERRNECLEIVEIAWTDELVEKKALGSD